MAAVTEHGAVAGAGKRVQRLYRFAVEEMARLPELLATPRASALAGARCTMLRRTWLDGRYGRCGFDE
jgi:hypothetical protein